VGKPVGKHGTVRSKEIELKMKKGKGKIKFLVFSSLLERIKENFRKTILEQLISGRFNPPDLSVSD